MARLMWAINDLQDGNAIFATTKMELSVLQKKFPFIPLPLLCFPKKINVNMACMKAREIFKTF